MTADAVGISEVNARVVGTVEKVVDVLNCSVRENCLQSRLVSRVAGFSDCFGHDVAFGLTHSEGADVRINCRAGSWKGNLSDDDRQGD